MVAADSSCYVLSSCEKDVLNTHLQFIKEQLHKIDAVPRKLTVVSCQGSADFDDVYNLPEYFVFLCRKYSLLRNERTTLLSSMDQLIALQLCLAERNKEEKGEYDVETSTVIQHNKEIINAKLYQLEADSSSPAKTPVVYSSYQTFLEYCNYVDMCDIFTMIHTACSTSDDLKADIMDSDFLFLGLPSDPVEISMLKFLCQNKSIHKVDVEVPLENDSKDDVSVHCTMSTVDDLLQQRLDSSQLGTTPRPSVSITENFVRLVYVAYLELLVNSRSELALARSLNTPERELNPGSFTDLKHEAKKKGMTMYQTAVSFIMKIRLGGKGYQPDPDSPIAKHVKGLGDYVNLIQRLQTIIEEEDIIKTACRKVLNVIKKEIVKCQDSRIRVSSVESVCEQLQKKVTHVVHKIDTKSPGKAACDGGTMLGRKTLKVITHIVDKLVTGMEAFKAHSLDALCDGFSSQKTPVRFPCLLSQFRSPEEDIDSPECNKSLAERLLEKQQRCELAFLKITPNEDITGITRLGKTPIYAKRFKSSMDWADPLHNVAIKEETDVFKSQSQVYVLPSKTLVQPAGGSKAVHFQGLTERVTKHDSNIQKNTSDDQVIKSPEKKDVTSNPKIDVPTDDTENQPIKGKKRNLEQCDKEVSQDKKKSKTQNKTCRRKLLPQVKGQQQINRFFRV